MNKFIAIIIAILALAAVAVGVFLFTRQEEQVPPPPNGDNGQNNNGNETQDWEEYVNQQVGFTIRHPQEVTYQELDGEGVGFSLWGPTQREGTELYDGLALSIYARQTNNINGYIEDQRSQEEDVYGEPGPVYMTTVDGIPSLAYESRSGATEVFVPRGEGRIIQLSYLVFDPANQGFQAILDNMLASLRITR